MSWTQVEGILKQTFMAALQVLAVPCAPLLQQTLRQHQQLQLKQRGDLEQQATIAKFHLWVSQRPHIPHLHPSGKGHALSPLQPPNPISMWI
mmetsp:Transcript_21448/g.59417  ORF Transcript_21448/g.59417 Transcript_21448/m.59417 type:complete len:92 (+) Transcript_21448:493-768(+)